MPEPESLIEEIFNSIIHGIGFILFLSGIIVYFVINEHLTVWKIVGVSIFGISILLLYIISTLFHSLIFTKAKKVFSVLDHSAIFLLIAGTYTPFLLTSLRNNVGWTLLILVWTIAIAGIVIHSIFPEKFKKITIVLYPVLGWLILVAFKPLLQAVSIEIIILLILGGIFYTAGMGFYTRKRMPFSHAIWHLFVITGSMFHFWAIYLL